MGSVLYLFFFILKQLNLWRKIGYFTVDWEVFCLKISSAYSYMSRCITLAWSQTYQSRSSCSEKDISWLEEATRKETRKTNRPTIIDMQGRSTNCLVSQRGWEASCRCFSFSASDFSISYFCCYYCKFGWLFILKLF